MTGKLKTVHEDGTWLFKDGIFTMIETNNDMEAQVPMTDVYQIIRIDAHEVLFQHQKGGKIIYKRTEP